MGEEKADPGPGVSRRNPLSRYVRGRGRRETGLKQSRRCTAGDRVPGANQYQYQYQCRVGLWGDPAADTEYFFNL